MKKEYSTLSIIFGLVFLLGELLRNTFSKRQKSILNYSIIDTIDKTCNLLGVPFKRYIAAIVITESSGNPNTTGSLNEIGLMQIYKPTFDWLNGMYHFNFGYSDLYAIQPNIYVGVLLFKHNLKTLNYDFFDSIMAYNVGTDLKPRDKAIIYLNKVLRNAS